MKDLIWYIAELVVSVNFGGDEPHEYALQNYIIKAVSPEAAYEKSCRVASTLNHTFQNEFGEEENHRFLGFHNLSEHFDANNGDIIHVNNTYLLEMEGKPLKPRLRNKGELSVFISRSY
ncbi:hypothetical protein OLMES_5029 [Oleiphilus messinensis]|uniref:DUF4288 domain-containing protein n=1 Tax=Oleiphilus messinensis TaxID=141451 RepID=A0A1Y0IGQ2_9GAMM|nr:DUF4288 domain-containing protein [Oleiphilus messinensis]ARU59016.1 hypothetical protein OLMES_5029 [Oleiphilus messinensis]